MNTDKIIIVTIKASVLILALSFLNCKNSIKAKTPKSLIPSPKRIKPKDLLFSTYDLV